MSLTLFGRWPVRALLAAAVIGLFSCVAVWADDEPAAKSEDEKKQSDAERYKVPDGDPELLLKFIEKMQTKPQNLSFLEMREHIKKSQTAAILAAEKLLVEGVDEKYQVAAIQAKLKALEFLALTDKAAEERLIQFAEEMKKDNRAAIAGEVEFFFLQRQAQQTFGSGDATALPKLVIDLETHFKNNPRDRRRLELAFVVAQGLEGAGDARLTAAAYRSFGAIFADSDDVEVQRFSAKFAGIARQVELVGNEMPIAGTTLDGKEFDWTPYKGKVVLVDFWATWCGPCIQELPNVLKNFETYHDRGFEVVGISLDEEQGKVEEFMAERKIPWVTLFSADAKATGWEHPMATEYGVMGIPKAILIGTDGKVVNVNARGEALSEELKKLFSDTPPAVGNAEEKTDAANP